MGFIDTTFPDSLTNYIHQIGRARYEKYNDKLNALHPDPHHKKPDRAEAR